MSEDQAVKELAGRLFQAFYYPEPNPGAWDLMCESGHTQSRAEVEQWMRTAKVAMAEAGRPVLGHAVAAELHAEPAYRSPMDAAEYWLGRLESALRAGSTVTLVPGEKSEMLRKVVAEEGLAGSLDDLFWRMHRHFQNRARQTAGRPG